MLCSLSKRGRSVQSALLLTGVCAGLMGFIFEPVEAEELFWTGSAGNQQFTTPGNWNHGFVPGPDDLAIFHSGNLSPFTIQLSESITNQALYVRNDQIHLNAGVNTYALTQPEFSLIVGVYQGETAGFEFQGHMLAAKSVQVGYEAGATGSFQLTGLGTIMDLGSADFGNHGYLEIGNSGNGTSLITDQAQAFVRWVKLGMWEGSSGQLHVTQNAQLTCNYNDFIIVGERGQGSLTVDQGGKVLGTYIMTAISTEGGTLNPVGAILVDGAGSDLTMEHQIELGNDGTGIMTVRNGATASTGDFGGMIVGLGGRGELSIESGGVLTSTHDSSIAAGVGSTGRAKVTGQGSHWDLTSATLHVGIGGNAGGNPDEPGLMITDRGRADVGQLLVGNFAVEYDDVNQVYSVQQGPGIVTVRGAEAVEGLPVSKLQVYSLAIIGNGGDGWLNVQQGGEVEIANLLIGQQIGFFDQVIQLQVVAGNGQVVVDDAGSILKVTASDFRIGFDDQGEMTIRSGGKVVSVDHVIGWYDDQGQPVPDPEDPNNPPTGVVAATSSAWVVLGDTEQGKGRLTVTGNGSVFQNDHAPLLVGQFGQGQLTIDSGGLVHNPHGELWVAREQGSLGSVIVQNAGSRLIQESEYPSVIGGAGEGNLTIDDGGYAEVTQLMVGDQSSGVGNVTVWRENSLLKVAQGDFIVGDQGLGFVSVYEKAQIEVTQGNLMLGTWAGAMGQVLVTGEGSKLTALGADENDYGSWVGRAGTGELFINDMGMVHLHRLTIGEQPGGQGVVAITGGAMLKTNRDIMVGWGDQGTGHVFLDDGIIDNGETLALGHKGLLTGVGEITGHVYNGFGVVSPGHSPGLLSMGSYFQDEEGTLIIDIAGLVRGSEYDGLNVTNNSSFKGVIKLLFSTFAPQTDDRFDLIIADSLFVSDNLTIEVQGLMPGWQYQLISTDTTLTILSLNDAMMPEPATLSLLVFGVSV